MSAMPTSCDRMLFPLDPTFQGSVNSLQKVAAMVESVEPNQIIGQKTI